MTGIAHSVFDPSIFSESPTIRDFHQPTGQLMHNWLYNHVKILMYSHISTDSDQLQLARVIETIEDVLGDWYSLAVQLDISYRVRKVRIVIRDIKIHESEWLLPFRTYRRITPLIRAGFRQC